MFQGDWKCSKCGGAITELPFQPRGESGLTCRACYGKQKDSEAGAADQMPDDASMMSADEMPDFPEDAGLAGEQPPAPDFESAPAAAEKPKHAGEWKCAGCGAAITSLPFEPRNTENLKCLDCFKKSKA
ncbi:MAG: CxxC-x17-CxxC domain-containing protein [Patiriisocius sp.]|jgi:CxxC-x17-CxxC domain-containing protein